ncbi:UU173 family protein [Mycoplasmopsis meleagridis]|uniref:UU173 family protein n=1 Tax=Mycoplasmopsis meleagridis TaxID=29561 RepID=UPI00073D6B49|nr:DUF2779 domain-containing protein [Mycoplasmopsis meleagridis]KUH47301.1 hypothetical protein ASB56_02170 [Mycoplasmopsis meleagridis]
MEKKDIEITYKEYLNSFISQPFFIWEKNYLNKETGEINLPNEDINGFKLKNNYDDNSYLNSEYDEDEIIYDDDDRLDFITWNLIIEKAEQKSTDKLKNIINNENRIRNWINNNIEMQVHNYLLNDLFKNYKYQILPKNKTNEENIINLKNALANNEVDLIINVNLIHKIQEKKNIYLKASFLAYDKREKKCIFIKYKNSTNNNDYLLANWIYQIACKIDLEVKEIGVILFDSSNENVEENKLKFIYSKAANNRKNKIPKYKNVNNKDKKYESFCNRIASLINNGLIYQELTKLNINNRNLTFIDSIKHDRPLGNIKKNHSNKDEEEILPSYSLISEFEENESSVFNNANFDQIIQKIIDAYYLNKPLYSNNLIDLNLEKDINAYYGKNKILLSYFLSYTLGKKYEYSTGVKPLKNELNQAYIDDLKKVIDNLRKKPNYFSENFIKELSKYLIKDKRYIWYDYEGVSSITPIIDYVNSYYQIPFQVSIVETVNGEIVPKNNNISLNIVKDTANISLIDVVDNIISVYSNKADFYIVYNKGYENTRNKEIAIIVKKSFEDNKVEFIKEMKKRNLNQFSDFENIVEHINSHTLDLRDFLAQNDFESLYVFPIKNVNLDNRLEEELSFNLNLLEINKTNEYQKKCNYLKEYSIKSKSTFFKNSYIYELKGKTSIKKIEKLITANKLNLKYKEYFKEYKNLEIKNGSMAMQVAVNRYIKAIGDNEWKEKEKELKKYCQNDVIAMLVSFSFFKNMVELIFPIINKLAYKIEINEEIYFDKESKNLNIREKNYLPL